MLTIYIGHSPTLFVYFLVWSPPWEVVRLQWTNFRLFRYLVQQQIAQTYSSGTSNITEKTALLSKDRYSFA
ncbi:hypothetical protein BAUCODRAFT_33014 [Baudoinia panamericana UAMH 10762]|uniref:Uncharacterized protein n=1 Tax=Baudoinia panamericana (strain UAMH 10762) TaxID=717646 RepID=M2NDI3_BAUPA|nr:uncharacterized protein BAUCODRAFT_33014 [Baudoinia panamericana UAMH 10762]EMC97284.1 hypothetical protein BAUCODRAFT_33014 [Baudoinia panamericana UAMH 10762]